MSLFAVQTGCHIFQAQQLNKPHGNAKKSLREKKSLDSGEKGKL